MIRKFLRYSNSIFDHRQKTGFFGLLVLIIIGSFFETLGVSAILPLVSIVSYPEKINEGVYHDIASAFGISEARTLTLILAGVLIVIYIVKNAFILFMYNMQYRYVYNNQRIISKRLMSYYLNREYLFHTIHGVPELQRNIGYDVNGFFIVVLNVIQLISEAVTCLFLIVFLMIQDVFTTSLILVLMGVFIMIVFYVFKRKLVVLGGENREATASMNKSVLHAFEGIKEIKASDKEAFFLCEYDKAYRDMVSFTRRANMIGISPRPMMETVMICGLLGFISLRVYIGGDMTSFIPILSVFAVAAIRMLPSFNRISGNLGQILTYKACAEALYQDLRNVDSKEISAPEDVTLPIQLDKAIHLENITFYYPERPDRIVLNDVSFNIPRNTSVAFIGPTGAGKTTLADIILGLLPPVSGKVLADNTDIYEHLHGWHSSIGYIPQEIYLVDGTIRENVAFGIKASDVSDEEIWEALRQAQAYDFVDSLTDKLQARVGPDGVQLSGGQRQRIGIARALLRKPEILVLDEATSALDNDTESAVMEAINSFAGRKTLIIIAHRLSTIEGCDRVYEVKDGSVKLRS